MDYMKRLTPEFSFDLDVSEFVRGISEKKHDRDALRRKVLERGFGIRTISPEEPESARILCSDSSFVTKSLRFTNLWGIHTVTLYAEFDSDEHDDALVGHGGIRYKNITYDSDIALGESISSEELDRRVNSVRISREYGGLSKWKSKRPDFLIVDGSLYTNSRNAEMELPGRCVGMVEDSHSVDVTGGMGLDMSNLNLFDLVLEPLEYVVDEKEKISVCYVKLPSKKLDFLPSRESGPVTVRWEFSYQDFEKDLNGLVGIWLTDNDALHSQIYPVRIADYLTRRIKVGGILDDIIMKSELAPEFRDMREG